MNSQPRAVLSMHDVMPETLSLVEDFLAFCSTHAIPPMTLLVVPGCDWRDEQLDRLRDLAGLGHELAAHGWLHRVGTPQSLYHRLHSTLLSRNVAEHLALDGESILALMRRSHAWFAEHDLPAPSLYVPPAWALGAVARQSLASLDFARIEVLRGVLDLRTAHLHPLPLVGFEADSGFRAAILRLWNSSQTGMARISRRTLRIGVHPQDLNLRLGGSLRELLKERWHFISYGDVL
ncbi:polysaccharide deacetylase family protein [uncultured Porticoccus sp.]|uniref:polysaccharide deacetylase family protein n=1 Tax=uncultured Porticoccus sp. TaxID=1256050 RepID=UPI0030DB5DDF